MVSPKYDTPNLEDSDLIHLSTAQNINIGNNFDITDTGIARLHSVVTLGIWCCLEVSDGALLQLEHLKEIDISECGQITDAAKKTLYGRDVKITNYKVEWTPPQNEA